MAKHAKLDLDQVRHTKVITKTSVVSKPKETNTTQTINCKYINRVGHSGLKPGVRWKDPTDFSYRGKLFQDTSSGIVPETKGFTFDSFKRFEPVISGQENSKNYFSAAGYWGKTPAIITSLEDKYLNKDAYWTGSDAIRKAYNRSNDSDLHLGMFFAGMPQTFSFIAQQALSIRKGIRLLKTGRLREASIALGKKPKRVRDFNAAKAGTKELSNRWLELQFAWGPLLADVHGIMNHQPVPQTMLDMPTIHSRGIGKVMHDEVKTAVEGNRFYGPSFQHNARVKGDTFSLCRLDYRVGDPMVYQASLLGLLNPLEVAWDLIPFSFVLDWFAPVGSTIQAMTANAGLELISGSLTDSSKLEIVGSTNGITTSRSNYQIKTRGTMDYSLKSQSVRRKRLYSNPSLRLPTVRYPTSMWHAITSLSLLSQMKG